MATAASGIGEEVAQGVRVALGTGFARRIAATGEPVILSQVDPTTVSNPSRCGRPVPLAEDACAAAMRALVGNAQATDDVALLVAYREPDQVEHASVPGK